MHQLRDINPYLTREPRTTAYELNRAALGKWLKQGTASSESVLAAHLEKTIVTVEVSSCSKPGANEVRAINK